MKIGEATTLSRESLPDAPNGEWLNILIDKINAANTEKTQALQQNITRADNMNAAVVTHRFTHATERTIKNPLKARPTGIVAERTQAIASGTRYRVADLDWRFIDPPDPTHPQQLGITVRYAPETRGETQRSFVPFASSVALTSTVAANVTSLSVPAGKWLLSGMVVTNGDNAAVQTQASVGTASATIATFGDAAVVAPAGHTAISAFTLVIPPVPVTLSAATTYYLVSYCQFAGTAAAFGNIIAERLDVDPGAQNDVTLVVYGG